MKHPGWRVPYAVFTFMLCALWLVPVAQAEATFGTLINKAGRQRMLTQRIVLNYVQIGLGVFPERSREQLAQDVSLFYGQLAELKAAAPSPGIVEALDSVERQWEVFQETATGRVSRAGARQLLFWNDDLLFASNKVVQLLQDLSGEPFSLLVNISGRQRMLSQRMAKFYMLREWEIDTITTRDEMERARNEFTDGLAILQDDPETTEAIRMELNSVATQWAWFENALNLIDEDSFRLIVAESSQAILQNMENVTALYEQHSVR